MITMALNFRQRLLGTTLLAGATLVAAPAAAQSQTPPPPTDANQTTSTVQGTVAPNTSANAQTAPAGEIIVTGSRIPQPNLTSTSPVTVVSAQEVKLQGTTRVEDLLNSLPQVFANEGSTDANGASGIATVDLRNLGPVRTLVLINGRRVVPGDPGDPVTDLNFIPASLIKRVDVLTGGASSVYGSDALAGVVNFIMDTTFTGIRVDGQATAYNHNNRANSQVIDALNTRNFGYPNGMVTDGGIQSLTVSFGADLGSDRQGHVVAYAGYRNQSSILQGDRDFSSCGLSGSLDTGVVCTGSSTSATGRFRRTELGGFAGGQPFYTPTGPSLTVDQTTGDFRPYVGATDAFNFNPYNYFQRPDERFTLGAFADYEISPAFHPYMEAMFMDDRTLAQIAPSGAFYGTDFFVNCDNPFLTSTMATDLCGANAGTSALQSVYIGRRNVEGGGRVDDLRHTDYRMVLGMKGDIAKGISYDAYGEFSRAILSEEYRNDFSIVRLNRALDVVTDPATGAPICQSSLPDANGIVLDPNCVPYNIFAPGGVSQAALNYLQTPGLRKGQTSQYVVSGAVTAQLGEYGIQSPWAKEGIGVAFGAEYRKDSLELRNDIEFLTGDLAGQGTPHGVPNARGHTTVKELFAEARLPIVSDRPFFQDLHAELGYRHSKYNLSGSTDAYKLAGEWAPTPDGKIRAGYNRAVRAPNVLELFSPPTVTLFSTANDDPCGGGPAVGGVMPSGFTVAQCLNTFDSSFTTAQATAILNAGIDNSPAQQYNQQRAGNLALTPEKADSYTVGVVLTPRFIPRFNASVDYYNIKVKNIIGTFGADFILQQCVKTGNPTLCGQIHRSPGSGSLFTGIGFVSNPNFNLGALQTKGLDVNASYRFPLPFAGGPTISLDLVGTYLMKYLVTPLPGALDVGTYNCAGFFGSSCGTPLPKWRHKLRANIALSKNFSISPGWRHFSAVRNDLDSSNELIGAGPGTAAANGLTPRLKAQDYFDLAVTASFNHLTWRLGALNVFDKQPPLSPGYSNNGSNTFAQVYDSLGRYMYSSVTLDF
jgi:outer membrane receptor protein involved in Fe transport